MKLTAETFPPPESRRSSDGCGGSLYQVRYIKRFGDYFLSTDAPEPFDGDLSSPLPTPILAAQEQVAAR